MCMVQTAPEEEQRELAVSLSGESLQRTGCLMTKKREHKISLTYLHTSRRNSFYGAQEGVVSFRETGSATKSGFLSEEAVSFTDEEVCTETSFSPSIPMYLCDCVHTSIYLYLFLPGGTANVPFSVCVQMRELWLAMHSCMAAWTARVPLVGVCVPV